MTTQTDRVRALVGTLGVKAPCLVATTANITLEGLQTIDGVTVAGEDRVLVKNQTTTTENGIWIVQTNTWIRAPDFDGLRDVMAGTLVNVASGTVNARTAWVLTTADATPGVDALTFAAWISPTTQVLAIAASAVDWDTALGAMGILTLTEDVAVNAPTNLRAGESYSMKLIQDGTGGWAVTWNAVFKWPNGVAPTLSTDANSVDIASFISDGTNLYGVIQRGFS